MTMKITILYDNTLADENLQADWGFSALVETSKHTILFDAGGNGRILMGNIEKLGIDIDSIDTVFISHHHFDHVGGLSEFLNENNDVKLFSPATFRGVKNVRENVYIKETQPLYEDIFTTGQLMDIEQSLIVKTEKGLVVIVGCSHPGLDKIKESAEIYGKVYAIVGGFHDYRRFKLLENVDYLCPAHCSKFADGVRELYPEKYLEAGAGKVLKF